MRKLLFIIVLFFSTSVLAGGKWQQIPFSMSDLLNEGYKIIDQYSSDYFRNYLLQKKNQKIILCRVDLDITYLTSCFLEEIDKSFVESD